MLHSISTICFHFLSHTHTPRLLLFAFCPRVWPFFALHAGMHDRQHIPLPYPGLLIRRSGLYTAASSVSILVCIKHTMIPYDRRTSTRYGHRLQHARLFCSLGSYTPLREACTCDSHISSFLPFLLGLTLRMLLFALLFFYLSNPPISRSCFL
jgi:hypothetical protein